MINFPIGFIPSVLFSWLFLVMLILLFFSAQEHYQLVVFFWFFLVIQMYLFVYAGALPSGGVPLAVPCDADLPHRLHLVHRLRLRGALPLSRPVSKQVIFTVIF
jgi:hypothetical protein